MKNRIFAALLALAIGAPLYLLSAHAAPRQTSPAAPAVLTAVLKAVPDGALRLTAALAPEDNALAEWQAQVQQEAERQQGPKGIDLGWWQSHYNDIIGYIYSPGTPISYPIAYDGDNVYYLHHDLYGNYSEYGTIFLDARVPDDFSGQHEVFNTSLSSGQLQRFIDQSTFYSGKGVPSGQIMTLCTCSYEAENYRYVVLGEMVPLNDTTEETA